MERGKWRRPTKRNRSKEECEGEGGCEADCTHSPGTDRGGSVSVQIRECVVSGP